MTSVQKAAEDIALALLDLDHIDPVELVSFILSELRPNELSKVVDEIASDHNLLTEAEAREKYGSDSE